MFHFYYSYHTGVGKTCPFVPLSPFIIVKLCAGLLIISYLCNMIFKNKDMAYTLKEYASRNELNRRIADNMITITKMQDIPGNFEEKAVHCFNAAYRICRDIVEQQSPVSIYKIQDYCSMANYLYAHDEDHRMIMKIVTISIVHILIEHFDEEWKAGNIEFRKKLNNILVWHMRLKSEEEDKYSMNRAFSRIKFFHPISSGIYDSLCSGTADCVTIPFEEFNPKKPVVLPPAPRPAETEASGDGPATDNLNARIAELEAEVKHWKDELDEYKERTQTRPGINSHLTALLGLKLAPTLGIHYSNKKELAPVLSQLFGWGKRKLEQEFCSYMSKEDEKELADIIGELSPELAQVICPNWQGTPTDDGEAPPVDGEAPSGE